MKPGNAGTAAAEAAGGEPPVIVKIGGRMAEQQELVRALAQEVRRAGRPVVLLHGGGAELTRISRRLGAEPVFRQGLRITSQEEMDVVEMVLSGLVNKRLVRFLGAMGLPAVGLSGADGGLFTGSAIAAVGERETRTGRIDAVDPRVLRLLLAGGYLPVVSPASADREGGGLNVNADTAAFELAGALTGSTLLFLSDIPGILKDGRVLPRLAPEAVQQEIDSGTITGGMIPKAVAAREAMERGVRTVVIGQYLQAGDLARLLEGRSGTRIGGRGEWRAAAEGGQRV